MKEPAQRHVDLLDIEPSGASGEKRGGFPCLRTLLGLNAPGWTRGRRVDGKTWKPCNRRTIISALGTRGARNGDAHRSSSNITGSCRAPRGGRTVVPCSYRQEKEGRRAFGLEGSESAKREDDFGLKTEVIEEKQR